MVKEAEAERGVREVVPLDVVLLDGVVYIVRQSYILGGGTATLVLVGGNVGAEVEGAQAFARDGLPSSSSLSNFDADVIRLRALLAQESYAPPVKRLTASGGGRGAAVAPNGRTFIY